MKKNLLYLTEIFLIILLLIGLFSYTEVVRDSVREALLLFVNNVFPSLFMMFIIVDLFNYLNIFYYINEFSKRFKINGLYLFVFILSMVSGFPSSAFYTEKLIKDKTITIKMANSLLRATFFANPIFIINIVGKVFLGNQMIGYCLFIVNILGNVLIYLFYSCKESVNIKVSKCTFTFRQTFTNSLKNTIYTMLNILASIIFFMVVINLINTFYSSLVTSLLSSLLEITIGIKKSYILTSQIRLLFTAFLLGFGGLSVHMQMFSLLDSKVSYKDFFKARLLHGLLNALLIFLVSLFISL